MTRLKKDSFLTLSPLVDLSMHFDFPERMCMYQSLSLSLLIFAKRFGSRSDPNGIPERMCFVNLKICACDRKYAKCRTKADAPDKIGFLVYTLSGPMRRSGGGTGGPDPPPPEKITKI